jgi:hypothetical protein
MANPDTSEKRPRDDDVIVPMSVFKVVTVFSTLIAAAAVVGGFVIIDLATQGGLAPRSEINVILALIGVGSIVFGSVIYVFSTRFRTEGMRSPKDGAD